MRQVLKPIFGVTPKVIDEHGVVSAAVAKAMALGAQKEFKTDYAIGVTE